MKKIPRMILGCTLAAALALTACSRSDSGSSGSMSTNMGGSSSQNGSCNGIDLARAFLIRRFGQDAKAGAVCGVLARLPRLR